MSVLKYLAATGAGAAASTTVLLENVCVMVKPPRCSAETTRPYSADVGEKYALNWEGDRKWW